MSKTLTEQYHNGILKSGFYYFNNGISTYTEEYRDIGCHFLVDGIQVLDKVPDYDQFTQLRKKVELLQKQLKEANHILNDVFISDAYYKRKQVQYLKKWGVK